MAWNQPRFVRKHFRPAFFLWLISFMGCVVAAPAAAPTAGQNTASGGERAAGEESAASQEVPDSLQPVSPDASEIPEAGAAAYQAPGPEMPAESQTESNESQAPAESFGDGSQLPFGDEATSSAARVSTDLFSFGDGTELKRAPSFGDGEVLNQAPPNNLVNAEPSPALAAEPRPLPSYQVPQPDPADTQVPEAAPQRARDVPPTLPPVHSDAITRSVYQLQTEVYGIRVLLSGRHLLSHLITSIDSASRLSLDLAAQCQGKPQLEALARQVNGEMNKLRQLAVSGNHPGMVATAASVDALLVRMRAATTP